MEVWYNIISNACSWWCCVALNFSGYMYLCMLLTIIRAYYCSQFIISPILHNYYKSRRQLSTKLILHYWTSWYAGQLILNYMQSVSSNMKTGMIPGCLASPELMVIMQELMRLGPMWKGTGTWGNWGGKGDECMEYTIMYSGTPL